MSDDMDSPPPKYPKDSLSRRTSSRGDQGSLRSSRHSPLAPLEYLQNQRRGSITDPSLHAAGSSNHSLARQPDTPTLPSLHDRNNMVDVRPSSPYVFGDATPHPAEYPTSHQIRKLLRSPSTEVENNHDSPSSPHEHSHSSHQSTPRLQSSFSGTGGNGSGKSSDMSINRQLSPLSSEHPRYLSHREPQAFDYNMRRHSIAVGQDTHSSYSGSLSHGTKRKMSFDRGAFAPVGEEIDPQLVGPGVPSTMNLNDLEPAPKRRGSAIDTQRIAQLSLYDRRNSADSRGNGVQWWLNDRRDSTSSSMFSSPSSVGYASGFSTDSPHGRPPSSITTFAWPSGGQPPDQVGTTPIQNDTDANMSAPPRPYDTVAPLTMMPPITFAPDRRMSVPENMVPPLSGGGPSRALRSRSRPPSRQLRSVDAVNATQSGSSSSTNVAQDDQSTVPPPPPASVKQTPRDTQPTPYSRSPELRVSHKLAERKRRKEMKDLFDELRDQLPADRGMKASKWEILSKAIDFITQLKQTQQDMLREIDLLRHELDTIRQGGLPSFGPGGPPHAVVYNQTPVVPSQYPPGSAPSHTVQSQHPHPPRQPSQDAFPPGGGPAGAQTQNGTHVNRTEEAST